MLEAPWRADAFLATVIETLVRGKGSVAHLIEHSEIWSETYNRMAHASSTQPWHATRARNLRAREHRLESMSTPLARAVMHMPALIATCMHIVTKRKGRAEARHAQSFFQYISEEVLLSLAMVADAGAEAHAYNPQYVQPMY